MALTDNTFTVEEFQAAVAANPALRDVAVASVRHLGLTPYSDTEFQGVVKTEVDKEIGTKINDVHTAYDKDILALTGETKGGTEKTYDYLKRAVGQVLTTRQTKIGELEKAIREGNGDATMKAQLEALQTKETQYQKDIEERDTKLFQKDVALDIRDGLRELKFDASVKESLRKLAISNATENILKLATTETDAAGNVNIRYVRDKKVLLDKAGQPATAAFLLQEELTDIIDAGQPGQGGGGSGGAGGAGGRGGKVTVPESLPADVKNQGQLIDYLIKMGVPNETKEFNEAFDKLSKGLPLR